MHAPEARWLIATCALLISAAACDDTTTVPPDAEMAGDGASDEPAETLAATGLYREGSSDQLAADVQAYAPRYSLWADGADKQRWIRLPPGAQIDSHDMDHWRFPTGTKAWKEFSLEGKRLETRLLWKTNARWVGVAYTWNETGTEARLAPNRGEQNVLGSEHDVPARTACEECHEGEPDRLLGVSAIQLSHDGPGLNLRSLVANAALTDAPVAGDFRLQDDAAWNALGYLHANCGNCHSPTSVTSDRVDLDLWLRTAELSDIQTTQSYRSSVGAALTETGEDLARRVAPGDPGASGLLQRMTLRGERRAMPPIASERVDEAGVAQVRAWIESL